MVEYLIVTSALVGGMFWAANADCPGYDSCISKLLTTMHDNYSGYSASVSAVQKYGDYEASVSPSSWGGGNGSGNNSGGGGSGGGTGLNEDGLTQVSKVTSSDGMTTYGNLQQDGSVTDESGNIVGTYDEASATYTAVDGTANAAVNQQAVLDEEGNVLQLDAVIDCNKPPTRIYAFGYQSTVTETVYSNVTFSEMDIGSYCMEAAYKIVGNDGQEQAGRIVDGMYYAAVETVTVSTNEIAADGEVVYWDDLNTCAVMVKDWDDSVDMTQSDEDIYLERLHLYDDAKIGEMSAPHYVEQVANYGETEWPNSCVSNRTLSQP